MNQKRQDLIKVKETKQPQGVRINKYLSEAGVCSRREADRQIEAGNVTIDGKTALMGDRILPGQQVVFCGRPVEQETEKILLAVHKPRGIVCTAQKKEKDNIVDFVGYPKRIYPVGRLDKDSEGLLLMTNQGDLVNKIMRAGNRHEKEYIVTVDRDITAEFLKGMAAGVYLKELDVTTRKCPVTKLGNRQFRIILTQGYNRQIRRMCEAFSYRVTRLVRVRIMNIRLGDLKPGAWRPLTGEETGRLMELLKDSSSETVIPEKQDRSKGYGKKRRR